MRATAPIRTIKILNAIMALCFLALGIVILAMPELSVKTVGITLGVTMAFFGVCKVLGYFSRDLFRLAFRYDLQLGIALATLGVIVACAPERMMSFMCIIFGVFMAVNGLFRATMTVEAMRFGIRPWVLILISAILSALFGLALVLYPTVTAQFLSAMLGVALIVEGTADLITVLTTVKIIKHQQPDNIDRQGGINNI